MVRSAIFPHTRVFARFSRQSRPKEDHFRASVRPRARKLVACVIANTNTRSKRAPRRDLVLVALLRLRAWVRNVSLCVDSSPTRSERLRSHGSRPASKRRMATASFAARFPEARKANRTSLICSPRSQDGRTRHLLRSRSRGSLRNGRGSFPSRAPRNWSRWTRTSAQPTPNSRPTICARSTAPPQRTRRRELGTQNTWSR